MRHLLGGLAGLLLTVVFTVTAGRGVALTFRQANGLGQVDHLPGLGWLLAAGACLGLLVLARRLSVAAPLTGAGLLLLGTLVGLLVPQVLAPGADAPDSGAGFGVYVLNGYGLGALFAATLLVVAVPAGRRARRPEPEDEYDHGYEYGYGHYLER